MSSVVRASARLSSSIAEAAPSTITSTRIARAVLRVPSSTSSSTKALFTPASLNKAIMLMTETVVLSSSSLPLAAASTASLTKVPDRLLLSPELAEYPIQDVSLRAIDASAVGVPVKESNESVRLVDVAKSHSGTVGSVAFVVRRPGCQLCREHGLHLSELAVSDFGNKFGLFGVVKETAVDDAGLVDFVQQYFAFDVYRDEGLLLYSALGNRSIFSLTTWNPLRWYQWFRDVSARLQAKNITGNLKGEGTIQGGILIFDRLGKLRFAYEEETGQVLDSDAILAALRFLEHEHEGGGADESGAATAASFSQVKEDL